MASPFRNIPGTFDILPDAYSADGSAIAGTADWYFVESRIREVMSLFNIREIRTPVLEPTELIARGIGQSSDIVTKEMFAFERGDTRYVLRPEVTASVMRSYLQHHLDQKGGTQRLFYMGPCFRAERPQKGRYRQFHQFGVEIIGADDALADAETIASMLAVYRAVGLKQFTLRINTLGSAECRPRYREALREYFEPHQSVLTETSRNRLETNPLRILDTKVEQERELLADAPLLMDFIDEESRENYARVKEILDIQGISYVEDPFLVRGLDYYSRTTFELESPVLGAQNALAGGGRYDRLSLEVGGKVTVPAVGFAAGFERLMLALAAEGVKIPAQRPLDVFLVALGEDAQRWAVGCAIQLRSSGVSVAFDLKGRSMKAQMKEADRLNAERVVIVGENELSSGTAQVRRMNASEQETVTLDNLISYLT